MPITLFFLWRLASGATLPPDVRIKGFHKWGGAAIFTSTSAVSVASAIGSWIPQEGGAESSMAHMGMGGMIMGSKSEHHPKGGLVQAALLGEEATELSMHGYYDSSGMAAKGGII
jgi:hypothetical protein